MPADILQPQNRYFYTRLLQNDGIHVILTENL